MWYTSQHYSRYNFSSSSNVCDLRPSPMDCAPISPMLFSVHPNTHKHIQFMHTINTHTHTQTPAYITTSLTTQIQSCKWCEWLESITNELCSNVFNLVFFTSQHTQTHSINAHNQHKRTSTYITTSLTTQIQSCKWCKWFETITNALCSNVPNVVVCTSQHTHTHKRIQLTHTINTQTHTTHITHHSKTVL